MLVDAGSNLGLALLQLTRFFVVFVLRNPPRSMRDLKNKMWKYGSFGGTERSLTSATYFDISKAGYVT